MDETQKHSCEKCGHYIGTANYVCTKCGGRKPKYERTCPRCGGEGKVHEGENHDFAFPARVLTFGLSAIGPKSEMCGACNGKGTIYD